MTSFLHEMGPQLKLLINITKGSMPLQCSTYFPKVLAILCFRTHVKSNEGFDRFSPINEISTAFYRFDFSFIFTSTANNGGQNV